MLEYLFVYYFHICNKLKSIIKYYAKPPLNLDHFFRHPLVAPKPLKRMA